LFPVLFQFGIALLETAGMQSTPSVRPPADDAGTPALASPRAPLGQTLLLVTLLLTLVPALGWSAWLLAALPGELAQHLPRTASLVSLKLGKLNALPIWATVGVLNVVALFLRVGARRKTPLWLHAIPGFLLVGGLLVFYPALWQTNTTGDQRWAEIVASGYLVAAALLTAGEILWLLWGRPGGIELAHLFIAVAVEWLLVFASADVLLRIHYMDKTAIPPAARFRLFEIAQLGVLANLVFAIGLRTWPGLFGITALRVRAWLLTLTLYNAGLILLLTGVQTLCVTGGVVMFVGGLFFLVGLGFLRSAQHRVPAAGRGTVLLGLLWLHLALAMLVAFCATRGPFPAMGYDPFAQAIEHAVAVGFFGTIVLGVARRLVVAVMPGPLLPSTLLAMSSWIFVLATMARQLLAIGVIDGVRTTLGIAGSAEATLDNAMSACAFLQCAALAVLALVVLRASLVARRSENRPGPLAEAAGVPPAEAGRWSTIGLALLLGQSPEAVRSTDATKS
jgi:hypothetical protein